LHIKSETYALYTDQDQRRSALITATKNDHIKHYSLRLPFTATI